MKTLVILTALCFVLAGISFAGNVVITEVVTGGTLTLTMPNNFSFPGVSLGAESQQTVTNTGGQAYVVEDSRGSGVGWNLGFQISQFQTAGTPTRSIPTANYEMRLDQVSITKVYGQDVDETNGPKSLVTGDSVLESSEVKYATAAAYYGLGKYSLAPAHRLTVNAQAYIGTYTATLTATLNATP